MSSDESGCGGGGGGGSSVASAAAGGTRPSIARWGAVVVEGRRLAKLYCRDFEG